MKMRRMEKRTRNRLLLKDLNDLITCTLCGGYLIDATTLIDCLHVFCRGCILKYFENCKSGCPTCNTVYKRRNHSCFRNDIQIQSIVYKLVPGLYTREIQRREDFYRSTGVRASSSCSDDSVLEKERDMIDDDYISGFAKNQFFGPDDSISLSLEYYQSQLDDTQMDDVKKEIDDDDGGGGGKNDVTQIKKYLQCPAAVATKHLQKFVRMKYALTLDHRVDIIYKGEVLPNDFTLMDVAYSYKWKRTKPLRFFYRIFTPIKIQPIRIINKLSSTGDKRLEIVLKPAKNDQLHVEQGTEKEKVHLLANLELQSCTKTPITTKSVMIVPPVPPIKPPMVPPPAPDCVFDYEEPDKEEIKRFAEIRDREWALQKTMDDEYHHHISKKRKKNKHSKTDNLYKKRKLHAEITNKEEDLKLKVKLTTQHNGHKHKHHKGGGGGGTTTDNSSTKEKLLQMRQIRHKHVASEDKIIQTGTIVAGTTAMVVPLNGDEKSDTINKSNNNNENELLKEWQTRVPTVQIERNEQTEQQAKKIQTIEKIQTQLEKKIANLQQQCTIETGKSHTILKPVMPTKYPAGFTVSKIETNGTKRKSDEAQKELEDKRPSLEITLISGGGPTPSSLPQKPTPDAAKPKRPPPATIPLERIKKSLTMKSGISIIPKLSNERCDNIGALDLSKPNNRPIEMKSLLNGLKTNEKTLMQLSNLQMLSKVATEHPIMNKTAGQSTIVPRIKPQMPSLQTLKIPTLQSNKIAPNLAKLPKLNEIDKTQFRMSQPQIRHLRPNSQNQNIRNIPNPSLLVRQQNQNRLKTINSITNGSDKKTITPITTTTTTITAVLTSSTTSTTTTTTTTTTTKTLSQPSDLKSVSETKSETKDSK